MASFSRLAQVEVQIVMQHCDQATLLRLARCSRTTLAAASHRFAWRSHPPLELQCKSPFDLEVRMLRSPLCFASLSVRWDVPYARGAVKNHTELEAKLGAADAQALAVLPGLRRLEVRGYSGDVTRVFAALLAHLDLGCALASLRLQLSGSSLPLADCESLGALVTRSRTLTALQVDVHGWAPGGIHALANAVQHSRSLATLRLNDSAVDDDDMIALAAAVARCSSLTDLQLPNCEMDAAGVQALVAALQQGDSNIRMLDLGGNKAEAAGAAAVALLLSSEGCVIEKLDLSHCTIGDEGARLLAQALRINRTLTQLRLAHYDIGTEGTAALAAALQSNSSIPLRHLDLSKTRVHAAGADLLVGFLRSNSTLEQLDLGDCRLGDAAVTALAACLPAAHSLRKLHLRENSFGVECATALAAGVGACPSLTLLDVAANPSFGDGGMVVLAPALTRLHSLDATDCGLTGGSAELLASLLQLGRSLHTLHLSHNPIGTTGLSTIAAALQSSSPLRSLILWECGVCAEAAAALGQALLRGWAVTNLEIGREPGSWPAMDDDGARALAAAMEQRASRCSLHQLFLAECHLTLAGALPLVRAAMAVPSLRILYLRQNPAIAPADKAALIAACGAEPRFSLEL